MYSYASLRDIKQAINTAKDDENQVLLDNAEIASRRIDNLLSSEIPIFLPYKESRDIPVEAWRINSYFNTFTLDGYLLEQSSIHLNGVDIASSIAVYPTTQSPIHTLRLTDSCKSWYDNCTDPFSPSMVTVDGIWGYRRRSGRRWKTIGTLHADIDADDTELSIYNLAATPVPLVGENNTLSAGMVLRIDAEYMVKLYSASGNVVDRDDILGTTAASHDAGANVDVFQVEEPIKRVVARQAGLLLARRGAYDIRGSNEVGTPLVYPQDLLVELLASVDFYGK